jgi:hypothetical protein
VLENKERENRDVHRGGLMTEGSMPPAERPKSNRQEGEQDHLREDAGLAEGSLAGDEPREHLHEDTGHAGGQAEQEDKGLLDKAKDTLQCR